MHLTDYGGAVIFMQKQSHQTVITPNSCEHSNRQIEPSFITHTSLLINNGILDIWSDVCMN